MNNNIQNDVDSLCNEFNAFIPNPQSGGLSALFWSFFHEEDILNAFDMKYALELYPMCDDRLGTFYDKGGSVLQVIFDLEPLEPWNRCLNFLQALRDMTPLLEKYLAQGCLEQLLRCLHVAWASWRSSDEHNLALFGDRLEKIYNICHQALIDSWTPTVSPKSSESQMPGATEPEIPAPAPQTPQVVIESPTTPPQVSQVKDVAPKKAVAQKPWPERSLYVFEQMENILSKPKEANAYRWVDRGGESHTASSQEQVAERVLKLANQKFGRPKKGELQEVSSAVREWRIWRKQR